MDKLKINLMKLKLQRAESRQLNKKLDHLRSCKATVRNQVYEIEIIKS